VRALTNFVTDLGDTAVTVPLAVLVMVFLGGLRQPRLALAWGATILACAGTVGALKLVLAACGARYGVAGMASPSGHAAMAAAVYGGFALLVANSLTRTARRAVYAGAAVLVLAIAVSRLVLRLHAIAEVAVGLAIGVSTLVLLRLVFAASRRAVLPVRWLVAAALVVIAVTHGTRWNAEGTIHGLAGSRLVRIVLPWCG